MTLHQRIFAIMVSFCLLLFILEMVRRRHIKEEYSWLWLLVGAGIVVLVVWHKSLLFLTGLIGAKDPLTTLFLFGFILLVLINIDYSVRISTYKDQIKKLAQHVGILSEKIRNIEKSKNN